MHQVVKRVNRSLISVASLFLPQEKSRELERSRFFRGGGIRMRARDRSNPDSYKVRRAKVGGYFDDDQLARRCSAITRRTTRWPTAPPQVPDRDQLTKQPSIG